MKNFYSFLVLLTLCVAGATFAGDENLHLEWWQKPNPTVTFQSGFKAPCTVIVDNLQGGTIAVGIMNIQDGPVWAVFTKKGPERYNPLTNKYGQQESVHYFVSIDELNQDLKGLIDASFNPAILPQQPVKKDQKSAETEQPKKPTEADKDADTEADKDITDKDIADKDIADKDIADKDIDDHHDKHSESDHEKKTSESTGVVSSTINFLTGKPCIVTVSASTCAAVAAFYAADWYNKEIAPKKEWSKIDKRYAAAIAGMSTAVICGSYFYYTATPSLDV